MARLAIGTAGQVLQVNSGATAPEWATPAGGGGMTLISTTTLSGASTTISSIPGTYKDLIFIIQSFRPASDGSDLYLRFNGDSAANRHKWAQPAFADLTNSSFDETAGRIAPATDDGASNSLSFYEIKDYANTSTWKIAVGWAMTNNNTTATNLNWQSTFVAYNQTGAISSLTFLPGTSTITSGTVLLYGVS